MMQNGVELPSENGDYASDFLDLVLHLVEYF